MTEDTVACDSRPEVFLVVVWSTWPATSSNSITFAALLADGTVVTWGFGDCGGESSAVQHLLRDVHQIQRSDRAFAAILLDGSVVTWGDPEYGGDSLAVQDQLRNVQQIQASWGQLGSSTSTWWPWALLDEEGCEV